LPIIKSGSAEWLWPPLPSPCSAMIMSSQKLIPYEILVVIILLPAIVIGGVTK